jgi:hypothetical protein
VWLTGDREKLLGDNDDVPFQEPLFGSIVCGIGRAACCEANGSVADFLGVERNWTFTQGGPADPFGVVGGDGRDFLRGEKLRNVLPAVAELPSGESCPSSTPMLPHPTSSRSVSNCFNLSLLCFIFKASIQDRLCFATLAVDAPPSLLLSTVPSGREPPILLRPTRLSLMLNGVDDLSSQPPLLAGVDNDEEVEEVDDLSLRLPLPAS